MHTIMAVKTIKNTDNNALFSSITISKQTKRALRVEHLLTYY